MNVPFKTLMTLPISSPLFESLHRLGNDLFEKGRIEECLSELEKKHGRFETSLAVGWNVIRDYGSGRWPSSRFREAWVSLKEGWSDLAEYAAELKVRGDFFNLSAFSLSVPEILDLGLRTYLDGEHRARSSEFRTLEIPDVSRVDEHFWRGMQLVGSYLGRHPRLPWTEAGRARVEESIYQILSRSWDNVVTVVLPHCDTDYYRERSSRSWKTWDELYAPAAEFDESEAFRNAMHLGWHGRDGYLTPYRHRMPMPREAARITIEMFQGLEEETLRWSAKFFSRIVVSGGHLSAKFTVSDLSKSTWGMRRMLVLYVPACALSTVLEAFSEEKLSQPRAHRDNPRSFAQVEQDAASVPLPGGERGDHHLFRIALPGYGILRSPAEGQDFSPDLLAESIENLEHFGIEYRVMRRKWEREL